MLNASGDGNARLWDANSGRELLVRAENVVNATGVFAEEIEGLTEAGSPVQVEPSKGVHLVFSREDVKIGEDAIVLPETDDKRILFLVPWQSRAIFGTTDTGSGDLDHPRATQEDISYLLKYLNRYLSIHLTEADIISTYAGYRPLMKPRKANRSTARLSVNERSEKNTSWAMFRALRSLRISAIIIPIARSRTIGSHSDSGLAASPAPCSDASAAPTGVHAASPAPIGGSFGRSISSTVISGISGKRRIG